MRQILMALGSGTGLSIEDGEADDQFNDEMMLRTTYQSSAVVLLLFLLYASAIISGLSFMYWRVKNNSPVTYYADPRYHSMVMEGHDRENFVDTFNQTPKQVLLQVTGFVPASEWHRNAVEWQGGFCRAVFTFSLDVSPWCVPMGNRVEGDVADTAGGECPVSVQSENGIPVTDLEALQAFLSHDTNDLGIVEVQKRIVWAGWEELATNIKQRIRQCGFEGMVVVHFSDTETVEVYKNRLWANFLYSQATRVLMALSIVGIIIYMIYIWLRTKRLVVRARHRVDIGPNAFWQLISDQLCSAGFCVPGAPPLPPTAADVVALEPSSPPDLLSVGALLPAAGGDDDVDGNDQAEP